MENGGERRELVMCSTCSGFVLRMKRTTIDPYEEVMDSFVMRLKRTTMDPDDEVVEVVTEAEKMRDLMYAVSRDGPLQGKEPAEATKEQWLVLRKRRLIMMETNRCPACSRSLSENPGPLEEAAESKEKKSSRGVVSELIFPSQGGKERKKNMAEDEVMVANHRSVKKSKRSRDEGGKRSSSGLKKKNKAKEGSGSKKKAKRSIEMEGSRLKEADMEDTESQEDAKMEVSKSAGGNGKAKRSSETEGSGSKEVEMEDTESQEDAKMEVSKLANGNGKAKRLSETEGSRSKEAEAEHTESQEDAEMEVSELASGNGKTKMVTLRVHKKSMYILKSHPPIKPYTFPTCDPLMQFIFAREINRYEVECEFHDYLRHQFLTRGYAEYQMEVSDDKDK